MAVRTSKSLLRWRWLIVAMIALSVITLEVIEHRPGKLAGIDGDFLCEVLAFGVAFPLAIGAALERLARNVLGRPPTPASLTDKPNSLPTGVWRVLVVENQRLLGAGIEILLSREAGLQVIGVTPEDEVALRQAISRSQPDVVVLDGATTDSARLWALFQDYPELRVVVVSADDGLVRTYEKRQVIVTRAADLAVLVKVKWSTRKEDG
jgi:hypothetical protein